MVLAICVQPESSFDRLPTVFLSGVVFTLAVSVVTLIAAAAIRVVTPTLLKLLPGLAVFCFGLSQVALHIMYDDRLSAAITQTGRGIDITYPGRAMVTISGDAARYTRTDALSTLPATRLELAVYQEDKHLFSRRTMIELPAIARAIKSTLRGKKMGASTVTEQLARTLLGIPRNGIVSKVNSFLAGWRLDQLIDRERQAALYLAGLPLGGGLGFEIRGVESAAQVYYGRSFDKLNAFEILEIVTRAPIPLATPYSDDRTVYRNRYVAVLNNAVADGLFTREAVDGHIVNFLHTTLDAAEARRRARLAHLRAILAENAGASSIFPTVDPAEQEALEAAKEATLAELDDLGRREGERTVLDAVLMHSDGSVQAAIGNIDLKGEAGSLLKPFLALEAIASGRVRSIDARIPRRGMTVAEMLAKSHTPAALDLAKAIGGRNLARALRRIDFEVAANREAVQNGIGSGVETTPLHVAKVYTAHFASEEGRAAGQYSTTGAGKPVFAGYSATHRTAVRNSLRNSLFIGTARKELGDLRHIVRWAKTGTNAFRRGRELLRTGGSWIVAGLADGRTLTVRIRYESGRPFQGNGGDTAAKLVRNFLIERNSSK